MQTESRPPESIATTGAGGAISPPAETRSSSPSESTRPVSRFPPSVSIARFLCRPYPDKGTTRWSGGGADDEELGRHREALQRDLADRLVREVVAAGDRLGDPVGDQDLAGQRPVDD